MTHHTPRHTGLGIAIGFFSLAVVAMTAPEATAQTGAHTNVSFAVAGGLNAAHLPLPPGSFEATGVNVNNGTRVGFIGGLLVDAGAPRGVGFTTGALVSGRGGAMELTVPGEGTGQLDFRMIYLDIPALARVPLAASGNCRFGALAGATIGTKLHARTRATFNGQSEDQTFTDDLPAMDFGLTFGGRADFGRGLAQVTYNFGLTDTTKGDGPKPVRHRVLSGMVGWRF